MRFIDMPAEKREAWVAKLLGFNLDHPETWDLEMIRELIWKASRAAERQLAEDVAKLGSRYYPRAQRSLQSR